MPKMNFAPAAASFPPAQKRGMSASLRRLASRRLTTSLATSALFAFGAASANAQTYNYTGGGTTAAPLTGNWNNAANWSQGTIPPSAATTLLSFGGSGFTSYTSTNDIIDPFVLNGLVFNSTALANETLTGGGLNFTTNGSTAPTITQSNSGAFTVANNVTLTNDTTVNGVSSGAGTGTITFSGVISGTGRLIDNNIVSRVILSGNNSGWTGGLTFTNPSIPNNGAGGNVVQITNPNALGTGTFTNNGLGNADTSRLELNLSGTNTVVNNITLSSRAVTNFAPDIENIAGTNTLTGVYTQVAGGDPANFQSDSGLLTLQFASGQSRSLILEGAGNGVINITNFIVNSATRNLTKYGSGKWTVAKGQNYTGATSILGGTLALDFASAALTNNLLLATSPLTLSNGTLSLLANTAGATTQTLGNLTLNTYGNDVISLTPNGGSGETLTLGNTWTRGAGSTLNFVLPTGATLTSTPAATNGVIGYATVTDSTSTGLAQETGGSIVRLSGQTTLTAGSASSATTNFTTSGNVTLPAANFAANSLTLNTTSGNGTLDLGGASDVLTLTSGGLLMTGSGNETIQNGQVGAAGSEVIAHQFGTGTLTIAGTVGSGAASLTKDGPGTLILSGANTYTGATTVDAGTLTLAGTQTLTGQTLVSNGTLNVATGGAVTAGTGTSVIIGNQSSSRAVLNINGGTLSAGKTSVPSIDVATVAGAVGDIRLNTGSLTTASELHLGEGVGLDEGGAYAGFTQTGGTTSSGSYFAVGFNGDNAVFNQSGGAFTVAANIMTIAAGGSRANGVVNLTGGTFTSATASGGVFVGEFGTGILDVSGTSALSAANNGLTLGVTGTASSGTVNLNTGGTITTNKVVKGAGTGVFNFNGGTLVAGNTPLTAFLTGLTGATVYSGGAIINDGGNAITINQNLLAPTGNGVSAIAVTGGTGYLDTPLVSITGGGGAGATGVATIDGSGNLTGITLTSPGVGYTSSPTVTLLGGGGSGAVIGSSTLASNTSGGLTKQGAGTLTLTGASTYTGATNVSTGTLAVSGAAASLGDTAINVASGATFLAATGTGTNSAGTTGGAGGARLTVATGGAYSMVDNATGTFNLNGTTGSTALTVGGATGAAPVFTFDITGNGTTTSTDLLNITGNVSFGASGGTIALNAATGATALTAGSYLLINAGGGLVTGAGGFSLSNSIFHLGSTNYSVSLGSSTATQEILSVSPIVAATFYWTGSQNAAWNTITAGATNFSTDPAGTTNTGSLPNLATDVVFTSTNASLTNVNTTLGQDFTINSLTFLGTGPTAATSYTVGGTNTLTVLSTIGSQAGAAAQTVSSKVALGAPQTWTNNSINALTFSGAVSGSGMALTTAGTGTIVLSGTGNSYSGGTTVTQGTLTGTTAGAFGTGNVTVNPTGTAGTSDDNATLTSNGSIASNAAVTVNNDAVDGGIGLGTIIFNSAAPVIGSLAGNGNVVLNNVAGTNLTTGGLNASPIFSGVISDGASVGSLTKVGTGTLTLSGTSTYSGVTTVSAGTLSVTTLASGGSFSSIGQSSNAASNLVLSGGTFSYTGAAGSTDRLFTLGGSAVLDASGTGAISFTNTGAIAQGGTPSARTLTLSGTNTGVNTLSAILGDSGTGANITSLVKNGAGLWALTGANTYSGGTTINAGTLSGTTSGLQGNITDKATLDFTQNATGTYSGVISSTGNVTVGGVAASPSGTGGAVTLTGANTYTGSTTLTNGTLTLSGTSTTSLVTINGGTGTTLVVTNPNGAGTGRILVAAGATAPIVDLHIDGGGTIALPNNYGGASFITSTIDVNNNGGSGTNGVIQLNGTSQGMGIDTINVTGGNGYSLYLASTNISAGFDGAVTFNPTTANVTLGNVSAIANHAYTVGLDGTSTGNAVTGTISNGSATTTGIAVAKTNSSNWVLTGSNTYTGGTTVSGGTLSGGYSSYGSGQITVNTGATVDYSQATPGAAANNITGTGSVTKGGNIGGPLGTGGTLTYTGVDSAANSTVSAGTLILNHTGGGAMTGPVAAATGGTIGLGSDNQIANSSNVTLAGGTLAANGHNEGISGAAPGMGTLTLLDSTPAGGFSVLDFGDAGGTNANVLAFADSSSLTWTGALHLTNYTDGTDSLYIGATNDLTTQQLADITFNGRLAGQDATGKITFAAAPEPSGWASMIIGMGVLGGIIARRRKVSKAA